MTPSPAAVAKEAQAATITVRDGVLAAELAVQAEAWRRVAGVLGDRDGREVQAPGGLPSYVRRLSLVMTSDEPHVSALAETALRRLSLTAASELDGSGAPSALRVSNVRASGRDAVVITVAVPPALRERFAGRAGQHVPLHAEIDGVPLRRSYSLIRSPSFVRTTGNLQFAVRREQRGRVSGKLVDRAAVGDMLVLSPPAGVFCPPDDSGPQHLLLIGAGSGITPLIALSEETLASHSRNQVTLVQVERCRDDVIGLELLEDIRRTVGTRFTMHVEETGRQGRPDAQRIAELATVLNSNGTSYTTALICGTDSFTEAASTAAGMAGIDVERVLCESFVTHETKRYPRPGGDATVMVGSARVELHVAPGESLLAALLRSGRDHPYSCLSGTCGSCAVQVVEGQVAPASAEVLGTVRTAAGWVLSCQAAPR